ncbi:hypothetical protein LXL04_033413 [Taraxacum kok-saghyz]
MLIDQWVWRYKTKKHPRNSGYVDQFAILGFPATRSFNNKFLISLKIMADPGPEPVYLRVLLHFRGNFVRDPASYVRET